MGASENNASYKSIFGFEVIRSLSSTSPNYQYWDQCILNVFVCFFFVIVVLSSVVQIVIGAFVMLPEHMAPGSSMETRST